MENVECLQGKNILVTGVTGFLGKLFVEKILRVQCSIKKLYLLIRAADSNTCTQRLHNEVLEKDVFKVLKEKWGKNLNAIIAEKVVVVGGDISNENLGIEDFKLREELWREIDIIVNIAATTKFDERYDVSFGINTLGAFNVLTFAKKCLNIKMLLHVSTAFVGDVIREEFILEKPLCMDETFHKTKKLDIDMEKKVLKNNLNELHQQGTSKEGIRKAMKDLGIQRAKLYGWPNTYVFTKAMGEMLLMMFKDDSMPLVVIRPTMILSTYKEPFPGWIEGLKTMDSIFIGYGKGKITFFLGGHDTIFDVIPADMVVNAMIVAMIVHASQPSNNNLIFNVGSSSSRNVLKLDTYHDYAYRYFSHNQLINKKGKTINIKKGKMLNSMPKLTKFIAIRYGLPLKVLRLVNVILCQKYRYLYIDLDRKINLVMKLIELYKPYLFFKGIFDDTNTEILRITARESGIIDMGIFNFNPKDIDWEHYMINTHFPGLVSMLSQQKSSTSSINSSYHYLSK